MSSYFSSDIHSAAKPWNFQFKVLASFIIMIINLKNKNI